MCCGPANVGDLSGRIIFVFTHEPTIGVGISKPSFDAPQPHSLNAPRIAYDDGQAMEERGGGYSIRIHVVDWAQSRVLSVIPVKQKKCPHCMAAECRFNIWECSI